MIVRAQIEHLDALAASRLDFWETQFAFGAQDRPRLGLEQIKAETEKLLFRPRTLIMVAKSDGELSYALATIILTPGTQTGRIRTIEEIYVSGASVRAGIGRELVESALQTVDPGHKSRSQIKVLASNEPALAFWRRLGFAPSIITLDRFDQ